MADFKVERSEWKTILDRLSTHIDQAEHVKIEVAASGMSDKVEANWVPLIGLTYDEKDNIFEFAVEGVDHLVNSPKDLILQGHLNEVKAIVVTTNTMEGHRVKFKHPVDLT